MKNLFQFSIIMVIVAFIASVNTHAFAQNSQNNGNGAILEDLNRLAGEIIEDIAESQTNAGDGLAVHDSDIKGAIGTHDSGIKGVLDTHDVNMTLDHDTLASDHEDLDGKLNQIVEASGRCSDAWSKIIDAPERFELVMDDQAVLDHETCLVWEKSPQSTVAEWDFAIAKCFMKKVGDRTGWRMPTIEELATLPQSSAFGQRLPVDHPFDNIQRNIYWSSTKNISTSSVNPTDSIWVVDFTVDGNVSLAGLNKTGPEPQPKNEFNYWCVRGGQGNVGHID